MSPQPAAAEPDLSPKRSSVAHAWLSSSVYQQLLIEADRRRIHPDALLATIAEKVLINGYVDAIVDHT